MIATATHVGGFDRIAAQTPRGIDAEAALAFDRSALAGSPAGSTCCTPKKPPTAPTTPTCSCASLPTTARRGALRRASTPTRAWRASSSRAWRPTTPPASWPSRGTTPARTPAPADTNGVPNDDAMYYAARAAPAADGVLIGADAQVSQGPSNNQAADSGVDLGDYTGLAFLGGVLYPLWADNSNSTGDNPDGARAALDQYTARVTSAALPPPSVLHLAGLPGSTQPRLFPSPPRPRLLGGRTDYRFRVQYFSPAGIDASTLDDSDILVSGPAFGATANPLLPRWARRAPHRHVFRRRPPGPLDGRE